jgi:cytochrome c553
MRTSNSSFRSVRLGCWIALGVCLQPFNNVGASPLRVDELIQQALQLD